MSIHHPAMNTATLSECGKYRYLLGRRIPQIVRWVKPCLFILLNPSTADAMKDDPTLRRCIGYARKWLCTELTVVNLFAYRATDPDELQRVQDPVGPENEAHLREQLQAHQTGVIVAGWGAHQITKRQSEIKNMIANFGAGASCLGVTKDGHPLHPLYVRGDVELKPWVYA